MVPGLNPATRSDEATMTFSELHNIGVHRSRPRTSSLGRAGILYPAVTGPWCAGTAINCDGKRMPGGRTT